MSTLALFTDRSVPFPSLTRLYVLYVRACYLRELEVTRAKAKRKREVRGILLYKEAVYDI